MFMKKVMVIVLTLVVLTSSSVFAAGNYGNVSSWAVPELDRAVENDIVTDMLIFKNCKRDITRQEFATLVVNMYKAVTEESPVAAPTSTFTDTVNKNILIAYKLGIINGVGNNKFAPNDPIKRQEMAVMMQRAVNTLGVHYESGDGVLTVSDKATVASWAVKGVDFAFENGFMKGDGVNFGPLSTTSVEQGTVIVNRVFEKYYEAPVLEANDYTKGYTTKITDKGLEVTYNNNGQSEIVIPFGEGISDKNGGRWAGFSRIYNVRHIDIDPSKIYFTDSANGRFWIYDFSDGLYQKLSSSYGGALAVTEYEVIEYGNYYG